MNDFKLRIMKHVAAELREAGGKETIPPLLYIKTRMGKHRIVPVPPEMLINDSLKDKLKEVIIYINTVTKSEYCCFVAECRVGAGDQGMLEKVLTAEELRQFKTGECDKEIYEKVRQNSEYVDGVFLQFESADDNSLNEFMGFEVLEDGMIKPMKHSKSGESLVGMATANLGGRFVGLYG